MRVTCDGLCMLTDHMQAQAHEMPIQMVWTCKE